MAACPRALPHQGLFRGMSQLAFFPGACTAENRGNFKFFDLVAACITADLVFDRIGDPGVGKCLPMSLS